MDKIDNESAQMWANQLNKYHELIRKGQIKGMGEVLQELEATFIDEGESVEFLRGLATGIGIIYPMSLGMAEDPIIAKATLLPCLGIACRRLLEAQGEEKEESDR